MRREERKLDFYLDCHRVGRFSRREESIIHRQSIPLHREKIGKRRRPREKKTKRRPKCGEILFLRRVGICLFHREDDKG